MANQREFYGPPSAGYGIKNGTTPAHELYSGLKDFVGDVGSWMSDAGSAIGLTDDDKKELEYLFGTLPIVGDLMGARDDYNYMSDYLSNRGLDWSDMLYPTRMTGNGGASNVANASYRFVSKNILDLYR